MNRVIAVPTNESGILDAHFGHCKYFELFSENEGMITSEEKIVPPPHEPGLLPKWLADKGATDIIAGGMGQKAIQLFNQRGVNVFVGAPQLSAKELVEGFITEDISFQGNFCDH